MRADPGGAGGDFLTASTVFSRAGAAGARGARSGTGTCLALASGSLEPEAVVYGERQGRECLRLGEHLAQLFRKLMPDVLHLACAHIPVQRVRAIMFLVVKDDVTNDPKTSTR